MTGTISGANAVSKSNMRIHLRGLLSRPQFAAFGGGRFTVSGAITERGRFVDEYQGHHPPREARLRTLHGAKGTS